MTSVNIRLTGLASILAGISLFAGGVIHLGLDIPSGHWLMFFGDVLMIFALTGLYGVQARQTGLQGLAGYVFSVVGWIILIIGSFFVLTEIEGLKTAHDAFMFMYIDMSMYLPGLYAMLLGMVMFGLASAYGRVLPRPAGILLALAAISDLPAELLMSMAFMYFVSLALTLISLVWMGAYLLKRQTAPLAAFPAPLPTSSAEL